MSLCGYTEFGLEVRKQLLEMELNLNWLASVINCSPGHLSDMLKGNRRLVSRDQDWSLKIRRALDDESRRREAVKENI